MDVSCPECIHLYQGSRSRVSVLNPGNVACKGLYKGYYTTNDLEMACDETNPTR